MADELPDWAQDTPPPPTVMAQADLPDWAREPAPAASAPPPPPRNDLPDWAAEPAKPKERAMPGIGEAAAEGFFSGIHGVGQTAKALSGEKPTESQQSPAAEPLAWSDVLSPVSKLAPKLAYGAAHSSPMIAGGIMGAGAGAMTPVPGGTLAGGALGAGMGTAVQSLGENFARELKASPDNPDAAWDRAMTTTGISGAASAAGWAAFPLKLFNGPIKQAAFQAFGVQPGIAVTERAAQNVAAGRDTTEGLGDAYSQGVLATAPIALGHAAIKHPFRAKEAPRATPEEKNLLTQAKLLDDMAEMPGMSTADKIALQGQAETIRQSAGRANTEAVGSRIADEEPSSRFPSFNRLYTMVKDDLNPIREARNILNEGRPALPTERDPYALARLTRGSFGKAEHFVDHSTFDPITLADNGPGLRTILEPVANDIKGMESYMIARRAVELDAQGRKTGVPMPEAREVIRSGNAKYGPVFDEYVKYNERLLDYLVKSGVISRESKAAMRDMHKDYVPFYRLLEEPETSGIAGAGQGLKVRNPIMGLSQAGSDLKILNPVESTIKNTYTFVALADRNMAMRALEDLANSSPRGSEILQKVTPPAKPITVKGAETAKALSDKGITTSAAPEDFTIFRRNAFNPAPDEIAIFRDGKRNLYKVDPYLASAINGLDRESLGVLTNIIAGPARLLRAGATLSPEFIVRNPVRDQFAALIYSTLGRGYVPFYDFTKGLGDVLTKGEGYKNWLKSGGANSALVSIDRNYVENLVRSMRDPTVLGTVRNVVRSPLDGLRAMSELMENATRVGEYKRMQARGETPQAAGFASREITLDFQRMGSKMRGVNAVVAFFNAQAEGIDRTFRAAGASPLGFLTKAAAAITVPSILLWAANKDDPRYKELPRWQKDMFWMIMTDKWEPISAQDAQKAPAGYTRQKPDGSWEINNGNIWRVPKPFELGIVFGSVPERILESYYNKNPQAFKGIFKSLGQAFVPNYIPQVASPIIEQFANRSLFTDRPLIPKYLENLTPQHQANPYTTETAKGISAMLSKIPGLKDSDAVSPIIIENYIRAWTGGLGKHALDSSDWLLKKAGIVPSKVLPTLTNSDRAILKAFAVRFPEAGANSIQDFYEEVDKREKLKKTQKFLQKAGQAEDARAISENNVLYTADNLKKAIGTQMKLVRDAYKSDKMTAEEKRKFIDMSYLQAIKLAQMGNEILKKTEEAFKAKKREGVQ